MPLTEKGKEVLSAYIKEYGEEKGKAYFYAKEHEDKSLAEQHKTALGVHKTVEKHHKK